MTGSVAANARWLVLSVLVIAADQATKALAQMHLEYRVPVELAPFLNLALTYNPGAAFSILGDAGGWQRWFLIGIGAVVSAGLIVWLLRLPAAEGRWLRLALALVVGGALGNVWDRVQLGMVVDFIDLHWGGWHWPAFNVADSALTVGAVVLVVLSFRKDAPRPAGADLPRDRDATKD
jgi:signal peptidase II